MFCQYSLRSLRKKVKGRKLRDTKTLSWEHCLFPLHVWQVSGKIRIKKWTGLNLVTGLNSAYWKLLLYFLQYILWQFFGTPYSIRTFFMTPKTVTNLQLFFLLEHCIGFVGHCFGRRGAPGIEDQDWSWGWEEGRARGRYLRFPLSQVCFACDGEVSDLPLALPQPMSLSFYLLSPVQEGSDSALVDIWHPARVNPPHTHNKTNTNDLWVAPAESRYLNCNNTRDLFCWLGQQPHPFNSYHRAGYDQFI